MRLMHLCSVAILVLVLSACSDSTNKPASSVDSGDKPKDPVSNGSRKTKDAASNQTEIAKGKIKSILSQKNEFVLSTDGNIIFNVAEAAKIYLNGKEAKLAELKVDDLATVAFLKENAKNVAVEIRVQRVLATITSTDGGSNGPSLKDQIVGKWTHTMKVEVSVKMTYTFTKEGNWSLVNEIPTVVGTAPSTSGISGTYKVLNEKELELTSIEGHNMGMPIPLTAAYSTTIAAVITGDELNLGNSKDATTGKPRVFTRTK